MSEYPSRLSGLETGSVVVLILFIYFGLFMAGLGLVVGHFRGVICGVPNPNFSLSGICSNPPTKLWGSEGGLWDHPEPNYVIFPHVAEFFATATAVPLAGGLLLYQGIRFGYNFQVLFLYLLDCWMYTCGFFAHLFLWPTLNAITLTSVLSNSLYTFVCYSWLAGGLLRERWIRWGLGGVMWLTVVYLVKYLPEWFGEKGGVPALLTIQTPAVLCALAGAVWVRKNETSEIFHLLILSGILLVAAMAVSLIEVIFGEQIQPKFGKFPAFHILIHTLEQIGIYLYGVGVAGLFDITDEKRNFQVSRRLEWVGNWLPYWAVTASSVKTSKQSRALPSIVVDQEVPIGSQTPRRSGRLMRRRPEGGEEF